MLARYPDPPAPALLGRPLRIVRDWAQAHSGAFG
jgi:hypothetical protein